MYTHLLTNKSPIKPELLIGLRPQINYEVLKMNIESIRRNYGLNQITLHAMTGREFKYFLESLDFARYEEVKDADIIDPTLQIKYN